MTSSIKETAQKPVHHLFYGVRVADEYKTVPTNLLPPKALGEGLVQDTSAHGIAHIFGSRGIVKRLLWLLVTLSATAYLAFSAYSLVTEYLDFEVNVKLDIETASSLEFPAVTICNQNMLRWSQAEAVVSGVFTNASALEDDGIAPFDDDYEFDYFDKQDFSSEIFDDLVSVVSEMGSWTQEYMGHQLEDLVMDCTYNKYECNTSLVFKRVFNPQYGNCYIFNPGVGRIYRQSQTGPNYGLQLLLNIEHEEYLPNVTSKAGVRVLVHPQSHFPFPEDVGVDASVSMSTSIGIRKVSMSRLGGKYDECAKNKTDYQRNAYEQEYNWTSYTLAACQKTCKQFHLMQDCRCYDEKLLSYGDAFNAVKDYGSLDKCYNKDEEQCMIDVEARYSNGTLQCPSCIKSCFVEYYKLTVSSASWPAMSYKDYLYEEIGAEDSEVQSIIEKHGADQNFLQLQIYYEELNYEKITETAAYTIFKFMSDLGGAMGMCLGASFITAIEFMELFADLLVLLAAKCRKPDKGKKVSHYIGDQVSACSLCSASIGRA